MLLKIYNFIKKKEQTQTNKKINYIALNTFYNNCTQINHIDKIKVN
jgi:hypothetical protein